MEDRVWVDHDGTVVGEVERVIPWADIDAGNEAEAAELASRRWMRFYPPPVVRSADELVSDPPEVVVLIVPYDPAHPPPGQPRR